MWFSAHLVNSFTSLTGGGAVILEENIVLIEADDFDNARDLALKFAREGVASNVSYLHPEPSRVTFMGIRKIVEISNQNLGNEDRPENGSELSYEILKFKDIDSAKNYFEGYQYEAEFWRSG